MISSQHP